ncbi:hypothetical protein JCM6882_005781 [Rhodosporidiobolus microsporus]
MSPSATPAPEPTATTAALASTAAHLTPSSTPAPPSGPASISPPALHRLATYGTLRPGHPNHHKLAHLTTPASRWIEGSVRGRLVQEGWGAAMGSPGIHLTRAGDADEGDEVKLWVLESEKLEEEWAVLDSFEGDEYERVVVGVQTVEGVVEACIYALKGV